MDELLNLPAALTACDRLGLEDMTSAGAIILLSKPPHGPPLYWHQDATYWNHPMSALPWPSRVFCPTTWWIQPARTAASASSPAPTGSGTELHDLLPDAHSPEMQRADETHLAFTEQPGEIDIPVKAGDLVIADGRVLHAAWPNNTATRRTLVLEWWDLFPFPSVPTWWKAKYRRRSRRSQRDLRTLPQAHPPPPIRRVTVRASPSNARSLVGYRSGDTMVKKPVTLGIVGARRGSSFARTALGGLDGRVRLTSVCDIDAGVLAQWRREHPGLVYYQSYEQFLAQANVDAVVLSTPLQLHAPQALQALAAGKHVLSEVIAATTLDECWALIAAVQQSGLKYMFAENSCYRRENMLVLNMVEQGPLRRDYLRRRAATSTTAPT